MDEKTNVYSMTQEQWRAYPDGFKLNCIVSIDGEQVQELIEDPENEDDYVFWTVDKEGKINRWYETDDWGDTIIEVEPEDDDMDRWYGGEWTEEEWYNDRSNKTEPLTSKKNNPEL